MNEVNWNNFKAKFYGKEPKAFEHLCYLLFCREFNQRAGIFRYKNQAGIETEPINFNGELIGFQSKFFEAKINQQDIKESIEKAKDKNPDLNKIYFYINQEFSESSVKGRKEPQQKVEIETFAKSKGVEVEWRVPSHIKALLSLDENRSLASYFFSLEKGVLDFLSDLTNHALAILKPIHSEIVFEGTHIKIDRSDTVSRLRATLEKSPLVILSGAGGAGKTALVKDFHATVGDNIPFLVFKAAEFNVTHVNELFSNYGNFTVIDFVNEHAGASEKYVVIDSAEKLSDLENQEAFQEFLSTLLQHGWKVIFTTRYSYLDDLRFQFVEIYRLSFQVFDIEGLEYEELEKMSGRYKFTLPRDPRLSELLRNPFYLNEYLQNYRTLNEATTFSDFKNLLWEKQIARSSYRVNNTHLKRERCFLNIAKRRADTGGFVISADDCADDILRSLEADEIIEHDTKTGGYFVTHDIYEEWALDKFIERAFHNSASHKSFFDSLGSSLSIRRAFRIWLSEKLFSSRDEITHLIEESFISSEIENFWRDEILVSVLLSDYSEAFFQIFEQVLLGDKQRVLLKAVFLLRIACKEIDEDFLRLLGISRKDLSSIKTVFTKPKGKGWECTIEFLYKHRDETDPSNVSSIIPLLEDWNRYKREGATTRLASLLALYYYEERYRRNNFRYSSRDKSEETLIGIILNGTSEIKEELKVIFNEVLTKREKAHRGTYYKLIQTALSSATDSFEVAKNLPEQLLSLADLFWFQNRGEKQREDYRYSSRLGVEGHFCISTRHREYYPASAFQTPIYQLLRFAPGPTIEFVLSFTNRAAECYAKSEFRNEVSEVEVVVNDNETVKQYLSGRLWGAYRGGQTSTYLLESIHMALERWLLEYAKTTPQAELEGLCIHLIRHSKSASITAVVESVVLAQPVKLFGVAKILFQTKECFFISTSRMLLDRSGRSHYSVGFGTYEYELHRNERMKTCDDPHRKLSLEQLAVNYQFFRLGEETEEQIRERQEVIWGIIDRHYEKLPGKAEETEADKTWRLYLARMDRRKMKPEVEERGGQALLTFNPEIEPELKQFSEDSLKSSSEAMRYTSLYLWSHSKFKREDVKYEQDGKYEDNVQLVISEIKEILARSGAGEENQLSALNASIPAFTCAVLVRDYFEKLSDGERDFCRQVITEFASMPLALKGHHYHIFDGIEPAIITLPLLIKHFPQHKDDTKSLLVLLLLEDYREDVSGFAANAVLNHLWGMAYDDAQSIWLGFLLLKPKYDALRSEIRKAHYKEFEFGELPEGMVLARFVEQHQRDLEDVVSNRITYEGIENIESLSLEVLCTAFELIPLKTTDVTHKQFVTVTCPIFSENLLEDDDDKVESTLKRRFFDKFADFILSSECGEIKTYLQPFVDNFGATRELADLLESFISAEDRLERYDQFWTVWNLFYEKIVELSKNRSPQYYIAPILHNYLLAWRYWSDNAKEWHTLKEREKLFFKKAAQDMGHQPSVLYSLSKILTGIGSNFLEDGIYWVSDVLLKNGHLVSVELETNTVYYIENISRKYILVNRSKIKSSPRLKGAVIVILNFLVQRGSAIGYLLREDIL